MEMNCGGSQREKIQKTGSLLMLRCVWGDQGSFRTFGLTLEFYLKLKQINLN